MITSVRIRNFKNIRDQEIDLERLTVFVGANGSGKTSVLEAIHLAVVAHTMGSGYFNDHFPVQWFYSRDGEGPLSIRCVTSKGSFFVENHQIDAITKGSAWSLGVDPKRGRPCNLDSGELDSVQYLCLDSDRLGKPSRSLRSFSIPRGIVDGSGLASFMADLKQNDEDRFNRITAYSRQILPNLKRISLGETPAEIPEEVEDILLFDFGRISNIPAPAANEGTVLVVGLIAALIGHGSASLVLIDDIEQALHPSAQKQLIGVIAEIMTENPEMQILATSHSPYLLHHLQPEQVRVMTTDENGNAICGKLTDHPKFEKWKDEMNPGEMWSLFGEKWLTEPEVVR